MQQSNLTPKLKMRIATKRMNLTDADYGLTSRADCFELPSSVPKDVHCKRKKEVCTSSDKATQTASMVTPLLQRSITKWAPAMPHLGDFQ
mmetsp:Transcript_14618/g.22939  ORF Transcript_14618/g.22939 Transcript_14618/m.22939 type:complete len:90 (-) Transcript_14618:60-329(-)